MMIETIEGVTRLTAADGRFLTDGNGTTGKEIWLGKGRAASEFSEVDALVVEAGLEQRIGNLEQVVDGVLEVLA